MNIVPMHRGKGNRKKVAVIGSGISGASAAWALGGVADVTLFEAAATPGGHTATVDIDYLGTPVSVDTGFIVFNHLNYPELTALFDLLDVRTLETDMSFSLSLDGGKLEWSGASFSSIFAQKRNFFSPSFLWMLAEILRFNRECLTDRASGRLSSRTIGEYLALKRFSAAFRNNYLIPMAAAIWSTPRIKMLDFPAETFVSFFENHRLIHLERPKWRTVAGGSRRYLDKLLAGFGGRVHLGCPVRTVLRDAYGVTVWCEDGSADRFDAVIFAAHSDQTRRILGDATPTENDILGAIAYRPNRVVLHRDPRLMPKSRPAWAAWNYMRSSRDGGEGEACVTYWMNKLQHIDEKLPLFVSLNPTLEPAPETVFGEWSYEHPQFDTAALDAQKKLAAIQGQRHSFYAGAWTGCGFHEDGLRSGLDAAEALGAIVPWRTSAHAIAAE